MNEAIDRLLALADRAGADIVDAWGRTIARVTGVIDVTLVQETAAVDGLTVVGYFGDSYLPLVLDDNEPDAADVAPIAALAPNERIAAELRSVTTSVDVATTLADQLVEVEVRFDRGGWVRTAKAFFTEVDRNWLAVAESLSPTIDVGDRRFELSAVTDATRPDRPVVYTPIDPEPDGADGVLWRGLCGLADAAAWMNLAHSVDRAEGAVRVCLIADEPTRRLVTPSNSDGGSALLGWATATEDANRREALDYVLTLVAAGTSEALPSALTVRKLAERQRIALSREQAAEVQRAIAEGQRDTADALHRASADFGSLVEETTTTANASIVAVLGLVVFVAQEVDRLPDWLIVLATAIAVAGITLVVVSRWNRIGDYQASLSQLAARLEADPLLPADDRRAVAASIETFGVDQRALRARWYVTSLGAGAAAVALSASAWLLWGAPTASGPSEPAHDSTTTTQGPP